MCRVTGEECSSDQITCGDKRCVRKELACDGTMDCNDGADERNCRK